MRILFICGSLEPGRDGVGDYTSMLAASLLEADLEVAALALNDPHITVETEAKHIIGGRSGKVLRLPSCWKNQKKFQRAHQWIQLFNPNWLSLQFVIFSFHPKGISLLLNRRFQRLGRGRHWHIMFHELWVGMSTNSSLKLRLWGWIQKRLISNLIVVLNPLAIHTQSKLYQARLTGLGFNAELLPLFGSIPFIDDKDIFNADDDKRDSMSKEIKFVLFGSIHPGAPIKAFANEVADYSIRHKREVSLTILGRAGHEQSKWVEEWQSKGLSVSILGEQSATFVSTVLSSSSIGLSTTPLALAEKSSVIAAMREHGLPVLCVAVPWQDRNHTVFDGPIGVKPFDCKNLEVFLESQYKSLPKQRVREVSNTLVATLTASYSSEYS